MHAQIEVNFQQERRTKVNQIKIHFLIFVVNCSYSDTLGFGNLGALGKDIRGSFVTRGPWNSGTLGRVLAGSLGSLFWVLVPAGSSFEMLRSCRFRFRISVFLRARVR